MRAFILLSAVVVALAAVLIAIATGHIYHGAEAGVWGTLTAFALVGCSLLALWAYSTRHGG